ncbi:MAG: exodeoxyribonuclease VII small subunit [Opitutaceae bacterium]
MASNDRAKLSFEQALEKLEQLIAQMEDGDIALADLLEKYESGTALLRVCETRLKEAELKIEQLRASAEGVGLTAFETDKS